METTCIRQTDLPNTSKLFADFVYHFDRVQSFYPHFYGDPAAYSSAAAEINFPPDRRAALVAALRIQNGDSESLTQLAKPGTVAVVTGQQVGLFSGPAYTIYKALTAVKLARELSAKGIPAVPIFWLATEDHDFAEINHCWTFDAGHQPVQLAVHEDGGPSGRTVGEIAIGKYPLDDLHRSLDAFPFGAEIGALVAESYSSGATLGAAFGALLKRLLPSFGLLHLDPMLATVRELAAPALGAVLRQADELSALLLARNRELAKHEYHAQVHVEDHTSLVFLLENGRRLALKRKGREYVANGRRYSTEELVDRAAHLSPNALLRPVIQDAILPTVAYVGGPAELAYLAQSEVIYRNVLGRMPVALPRGGFTIFDQRSAKLMGRYHLSLADFFPGEEYLREKIGAHLIPATLARTMQGTKSLTQDAIARLLQELTGFDPTLAGALRNSGRKIDYQMSRIERKIQRGTLLRDERASRDAAYLYNLIYPHKHLQERLYSILPFVARHGLDLIGRIYENIQLDCPDHRLLTI